MGRLASVVEFLRHEDQGTPTPEVKCDPGDGDPSTVGHFAPPGVDAQPLAGDVAYLGEDVGRGVEQALAYQDPKNAGIAGPGEHRIYSRSSDGAIVAELWLMADGSIFVQSVIGGSSVALDSNGGWTFSAGNGQVRVSLAATGAIELTNPSGSVKLTDAGAIELANATGSVKIDASGNVTFTTPLGTFGAATHTHASPFGPTGLPLPGT